MTQTRITAAAALAAGLAAAIPTGAQAADCGERYTVQPGDWLSRIAERCAAPMDKIRALNPELDPNRIEIGQTIRLAEPEPVQPVIDVRGAPLAALPPAPPQKGPVHLTAEVTRDAGTCLYLTDAQGRTYSFAAGQSEARPGMTVTVTGEVVENWYCQGGAEILTDSVQIGAGEAEMAAVERETL